MIQPPDWLDSEEFYEAMQAYRWSEMFGLQRQAPAETVAAFEAVKELIRQRWPHADTSEGDDDPTP